MSSQSRLIVIKVSDSGPGIPAAFLPKLFKPFSREDVSLTRQSEGLGLGLLVAKGLARKLGGDLLCTRAETTGPDHGSDFEMRFPCTPSDQPSRPSSPFNSPAVRNRQTKNTVDDSKSRHLTPIPQSLDLSHTALSDANGGESSSERPSTATSMGPPSGLATPRQENGQPTFPVLPVTPRSPNPAVREPTKRPGMVPRKSSASIVDIDRDLALKYPLNFLVAEDNKINRRLLVNMLKKFGFKTIHEAYDGAEAVRQVEAHRDIDVVLMDLWMPFMDGYEATQRILAFDCWAKEGLKRPTVLAVTADVTEGALERAHLSGCTGFLSKPYKLLDLQRLILEYCALPAEEEEQQEQEQEECINGGETGSLSSS